MRRIIDVLHVNTVSEMQAAMLRIMFAGVPGRVKPDEVATLNSEAEPVTLRLVEETLTDGSKVYNVEIE